MSLTTVTVQLNPHLLGPLDRYAADHGLSRDFVLAVAIDQFLSDPDNHLAKANVAGGGS